MITLRKNADRRVRKGHLWIFSNEIADPPVSMLEPGAIHECRDSAGEFLGMVYANPSTLIAARILSRKLRSIDEAFFHERIASSLERRKRLFPGRDVYRLVFGESDLLPGLVVDRYGDYLAVQTLTAGMDRLQDQIVDSLIRVVGPKGIYLRNDSSVRELEGLAKQKGLIYGDLPETVDIECHGLRFLVDIPNGQKTGFYLDQESNRPLMHRYVQPGASVLDLFCYSGAWGLHALAAGAGEATAVDSSRGALKLAAENAELNGMTDRFQTVRAGAIDFLKKTHRKWDMVISDPPAFIRSRSLIKEGSKGYIDLNRRALRVLKPDGLLVTCSCSHHLDAYAFEELLETAARQEGRQLRLLDSRGQGPDHPVLLSMPETRYLKVIVAQVV